MSEAAGGSGFLFFKLLMDKLLWCLIGIGFQLVSSMQRLIDDCLKQIKDKSTRKEVVIIMLPENSPYSTARWDPFSELTNLQRAINRAFESRIGQRTSEYPPLNVVANEDEVLVTAELPGVDPKDLDITVQGNTFTVKGHRKAEDLKEGERYHRQERGTGSFARSLELPYTLDPDKIQASLKNGVLQVVLPRTEKDRPRKVQVTA